MTAILGFNYLDGVLMMADTEETLGADSKSECEKLYRFTFPHGARAGTVITGGAGDSHLIECANQEMHQYFATRGLQTDAAAKPEDILATLNAFSGRFFEEVISPLKGSAYEPVLEMLITVNLNHRSDLFCWKRNRVRWIPRSQHIAIGSGVIQLHPMLRDIDFAGTEECMFFHGIRMMFHAKRAVVGVGGKTESVSLCHDGKTHFFGIEAALKTEELIINFDRFINQRLYLDVSAVANDVRDLDKNIGENLADLPRKIALYRREYKDILNPPSNPDDLED